jgi:uncharacterized protein YpmB
MLCETYQLDLKKENHTLLVPKNWKKIESDKMHKGITTATQVVLRSTRTDVTFEYSR